MLCVWMQGCALPVAIARHRTVAEVKEDVDAEHDDACTVCYWHSQEEKSCIARLWRMHAALLIRAKSLHQLLRHM